MFFIEKIVIFSLKSNEVFDRGIRFKGDGGGLCGPRLETPDPRLQTQAKVPRPMAKNSRPLRLRRRG
jgi:hypothetical protein